MKRPTPKPTLTPAPESGMPNLDSIALGLVALVVYLLFAPTVSGDKDASEFTLVLATRGVAHPTGYPLYTLLGHLFVTAVHALGATWSYAANAWSALGGALAIGFFHALVARLLPAGTSRGARRWMALVPVAFLLLNPIWTVETCLAEVYSWHVAWTCGLGCLFVPTIRRLQRGELAGAGLSRSAALWGFLCGVGLAHHATSVFIVGPLSLGLLFALWRAKQLHVRPLALALVASLIPLTAYLWIAWRAYHPAGYMWPTLEGTPQSILRHLMGSTYTVYLGWFAPSKIQHIFLAMYVYPFLFPAFALAVIAAWRARAPDDRVARWSLVVSSAVGTVYSFFYGVSDPSSYFLAPMFFALATAATLLGSPSPRAVAVTAAAAVLFAAYLSISWTKIDLERRRQFMGFNQFLHGMWTSIPFDSGFVFWRDDMYVRLHEYQLFNGEKAALEIVHPASLTHPAGIRRFEARYGFNPLQGLDLSMPAVGAPGRQEAIDHLFDEIEHNVNERSPLPVIHFDPEIPTVRLLKKHPAPADSADSARTGAAR